MEYYTFCWPVLGFLVGLLIGLNHKERKIKQEIAERKRWQEMCQLQCSTSWSSQNGKKA